MIAVLVLMTMLVPVARATYDDVDARDDTHEAVTALAEQGIFAGTDCGVGEFCPDGPVKRWAVAVWLIRALEDDSSLRTSPDSAFADVAVGWWWRPYVERLAELGITRGCASNPDRFCPDALVTRGQAASLLRRSLDLETTGDGGFADTAGSVHESDIHALAAAGIIEGCATGPDLFCPSTPITRAEMVTVLQRSLDHRPTLQWLTAGDSYSSGVGADPHGLGNCHRSEQAAGPSAAELLRTRGLIIDDTHTACAGAVVADMFSTRAERPSWPSMWYEHVHVHGGATRLDVIALSLGGNDLGFEDVVLACVPFALVTEFFIGCPSESELTARIDALLDPPKTCVAPRRTGSGPDYDCALEIQGETHGSIIDFYVEIVNERLTDSGHLFVIGYPSLIAPSREWRVLSTCWLLYKPSTVDRLGRVASYLNDRLREAVSRANERLASDTPRVHYVDTYTAFRSGRNEVCGNGPDRIHGITHVGTDPMTGWYRSFHPNNAGHAKIAELLANTVQMTLDVDSRP